MPQSPRLVLYVDAFFLSPYAMSTYVSLREKGAAFELRTVALHDKAQHRADYRDRSLTARVPMLEHDGFALAESSAIDEYLEEILPPPANPALYPRDVRDRARARQVQAWLRSDLMPIREERSANTMFYPDLRTGRALSPAGQAAAQKLFRIAGQILPARGGCLFDGWCIADTDLAFMLQRLLHNGDDVPPRLAAYAAAQWERPSVREWVARERVPFVPFET